MIALVSIALLAVFVVYWGLPMFWFWGKVDEGGTAVKGWFYGERANAPLALQSVAASIQTAPIDVLSTRKWTPDPKRVLLWWFAVVSLPWTLVSALVLKTEDRGIQVMEWSVVSICAAVACWSVGRYVRWEPPSESLAAGKDLNWPRRLGLACIAMLLNVLTLFMFWLLLSKSAVAKGPVSFELWGWLAVGIAVAVTMYSAASAHRLASKAKPREYLIASAVVAVLLLWIGAYFGVLGPAQDQVMAKISVRLPEATLVMSKSGCQALAASGLAPPAAASGPLSYETGCVLGPVLVKSRLGARWPVACIGDQRDSSGQLLTVKGDDVVDFLTPAPAQPERAESQASTSKPAASAPQVHAAAASPPGPASSGASSHVGYCGVFRRSPPAGEESTVPKMPGSATAAH